MNILNVSTNVLTESVFEAVNESFWTSITDHEFSMLNFDTGMKTEYSDWFCIDWIGLE